MTYVAEIARRSQQMLFSIDSFCNCLGLARNSCRTCADQA